MDFVLVHALPDYVALGQAIVEPEKIFALLPIVCSTTVLLAMPMLHRLARARLRSPGLSLVQYSMAVKGSMVEGSMTAW